MLRHRRGFTLIEIMICIAILAIITGAPISMRNGVHFLAAESDYRGALRNARFQIDTLRETPFGQLPPRVMTPAGDGWIALDTPHIVAGSIHVRTLDGRPVTISEARGDHEFRVDARQPVIVDFSFYAPDQGEAHTATTATITLDNAPIVAIAAVYRADGDPLTPLAPVTVDAASGRLTLPPTAIGHVIRVDYLGGRIRNRISGNFLGDDLRPCAGVGPVKQLTVEESYGGDVGRLRLQFLEVSP